MGENKNSAEEALEGVVPNTTEGPKAEPSWHARVLIWIRESWPQAIFLFWSIFFIPWVLWQTSRGIQEINEKLPRLPGVSLERLVEYAIKSTSNREAVDQVDWKIACSFNAWRISSGYP